MQNIKKQGKTQNIFTNKVVIRHNNKNKGRIMIEFTSADRFDRIMEIIEKAELILIVKKGCNDK